ncbi:reverse transcriptase (RNA-dependent DNA polymerase) domain-containing protein [Phthorimaea operculella]|nr:reverse transcriptase (RNA-dependent DNA polymerase) domain-containing protein [Phthorimaea operculella]
MSKMIQDLKDKGILEKPLTLDAGFHSRMFLVKKSDGGLRPIFDLRELNRHVATRHFQLISQTDVADFLQHKDWMVKIDLHQAYFHLPISEAHRRFLRVIYNGEVLQLTALPFRLSSAPRTFAAISNWVAELLRASGIRLLVYLDDFLLVNQVQSTLINQVSETLRILEDLGWYVNYQKSILEPSQEVEYLGLTWNTQDSTRSLPLKKVDKIKLLTTELLERKSCTLKELQRLLGMLNFATLTTPKGRLHCRRFQIFLRGFRQRRPRERRDLPRLVCQEIVWWWNAINDSTVALSRPEVTHFLTTDAADAGWGAHLNGLYLSGKWALSQRRWHSNMKEMFAVYGAINRQRQFLKDAHILVQSDNRTLVAHIRNEGGTRSLALLSLTTKLLELTENLNITLSAAYLPGRYNGIADRLSRNRPVPEWHLLPPATEAVFREWGVPDIDFFASRDTAVVPQYVTWDSRDGSAVFCDAFSRPWNFRLGWVFPPPNLIPRVLNHLNKSQGIYIVIAPHWTQCYWLADLEARALAPPLEIKDLQQHLLDVTTGRHPPQVERLELIAWKIGAGQRRYQPGRLRKNN